MNVHVFLNTSPHAIDAAVAADVAAMTCRWGQATAASMAHRVVQRSAARSAQGKVPAAVGEVTAGARTFVRRSHAADRRAHVATVAGDIVTPPFLRTRRTTYDRRSFPAPTEWRRILSKELPTPTVFGRVVAKSQNKGRESAFRSLWGRL